MNNSFFWCCFSLEELRLYGTTWTQTSLKSFWLITFLKNDKQWDLMCKCYMNLLVFSITVLHNLQWNLLVKVNDKSYFVNMWRLKCMKTSGSFYLDTIQVLWSPVCICQPLTTWRTRSLAILDAHSALWICLLQHVQNCSYLCAVSLYHGLCFVQGMRCILTQECAVY